MPVDFLTSEQKTQYGQFFGEPNDTHLARYFHLDKTDLALIADRRGDQNRFGFALQLTSVRFLGTFLLDINLVPINVQVFIARQLHIPDMAVLGEYAKREATKHEHTSIICQHYGYRDFGEQQWTFRLVRLLYVRAWVSNERPSLMFDFATNWLMQHKILLPGITTLSRIIIEIRERADNRLWKRLSAMPTNEQREKLESILKVPDGMHTSRFDYFRKGPVTISAPAFNAALDRYLDLREFGLDGLNFAHIPPVRLKILARHAGMISAYKIARMPDDRRISLLLAFAKTFQTIALDDALDVLDSLLVGISANAKKIGQKNRLRTLKDLDKSALTLAKVCTLFLNEETKNDQLRNVIYAQFSKEKLEESIVIINELARPSDDKFHDELLEQYGKVSRFIYRLLHDITFKAAPAGKDILAAIDYLVSLGSSRKQILNNPPLDIVTKPWRRIVFNKDGEVTRRGYILCFLDRLQDSLRRRDVYVEKSDRWGEKNYSKAMIGKITECKYVDY